MVKAAGCSVQFSANQCRSGLAQTQSIESRITSVRIIDPEKELVLNNRPSVAVPPLDPALGNLSGNRYVFGAIRCRNSNVSAI